MEEDFLFYRTTNNPRTTLLNAMRYLATDADFESREVYALSIYTLAYALVELSAARDTPTELRRRSPRVRVRIPVFLVWEYQEHTFTTTVSRFGCALQSRRFFEPGTIVKLQHEGNTIEAKVIYSLEDRSTKLVEVGLAFDQDGREFWGIAVPYAVRPTVFEKD